MKQHLTNFKKSLSTKTKDIFNTTKDAVNNAKITMQKPLDNLQYIKNKNNQIKDIILQSNQKIEPQILNINTKIKTFEEKKLTMISSTIQEYISLMKQIEYLPFPILESEKQQDCFIFDYDEYKEKFNFIHKKIEVDARYIEVLTHTQNIENTIVKFQHLESFMNNIIHLLERYTVSCTKLNKQTINIIINIGSNYKKYTKEQKFLIQKHNFYIDTLKNISHQKLLDEQGRLDDRIVAIIHDSNEYLTRNNDIVFKDFQQKKNPLIYILPIMLLVGLLVYIVYF
ncbi:MAG: hypothetical protein WA945_02735 [Arcobacteraceae bacterium]